MSTTLDYDSRERETPRRFWRAMVVALVGCPVAAAVAAVAGWQLAMDGWGWPPTHDYYDCVLLGLVCGLLGMPIGLGIAGIARALPSYAMAVSLAGCLMVSSGSGLGLYILASMAVAC